MTAPSKWVEQPLNERILQSAGFMKSPSFERLIWWYENDICNINHLSFNSANR